MRWLDITLPAPGTNQQMDDHLSAAIEKMTRIPEIQTRDGLDAPAMLDVFADVGRHLFLAVQAVNTEAFAPTRGLHTAPTDPLLDDPEHDNLLGYVINTSDEHMALPWHWLHNGVEFLQSKHPICTLSTETETTPRPWMQRRQRAAYLLADDGSHNLRGILPQLRGTAATPDLLFIPGHTNRQLRRLIYREAEAIEGALEMGNPGEVLAQLNVEPDPITPSDLCQRGLLYQALHFAGPTSLPATLDDIQGEYWMNHLIEETSRLSEQEIEATFGLEGEVLGVDPITSLLDDATANYELDGAPGDARSVTSSAPIKQTWLLDDGPVAPEHLGRGGLLPPLVFSNSFCSVPEMGQRFLTAGASTFVGPVVPLFSRPARIFVGHFYHAMGKGWSAGAALWKASQDCRREFGDHHPVWLSYAIQGQGTLSFAYI